MGSGAGRRPVEREGPAGDRGGGSPRAERVTLKAIKEYLDKSALGRKAVKYFEDKGLLFDLDSSGGCAWDGTYVIIDKSYPLPQAALSFVHEVYHAEAEKEGRTGRPSEQSKEEYLETMFNEEVRATIAAIEVRVELTRAGATVVFAPQDFEYHKACRAAKMELLERSPGASAEAQKAAAEKGGYDYLMARYVSGEAKGSRDGRPYTEIYGSAWERANRGRA